MRRVVGHDAHKSPWSWSPGVRSFPSSRLALAFPCCGGGGHQALAPFEDARTLHRPPPFFDQVSFFDAFQHLCHLLAFLFFYYAMERAQRMTPDATAWDVAKKIFLDACSSDQRAVGQFVRGSHRIFAVTAHVVRAGALMVRSDQRFNLH
jgi:hypothetical protein